MKISLPKLPNRAGFDPIENNQLIAEAQFEHVSMENTDVSGRNIRNLSLDESLLERVILIETHLEKLSISDSMLRNCDLSTAFCSESSLIRAHIIGGRMTGVDFSLSTLKDVTFENCKLNMANFRFSKLTRVEFINCVLSETDFQGSELTEVAFQSSHLEKVEFGQCRIIKVDARTSQLFDIRGWQSLRGVTIPLQHV